MNKKDEIECILDGKALFIKLPIFIKYRLFDSMPELVELSNRIDIDILIFDFEKTKSVNLPGVLILISLSNYFQSKKRNQLEFFTKLINLDDDLKKKFMRFGFFRQLSAFGNYIGGGETVNLETKLIQQQVEIIRSHSTNFERIFPIDTIPRGKTMPIEVYLGKFFNRFNIYYEGIKQHLDQLAVSQEESYDNNFNNFCKAQIEIIKNIYDHSDSLGMGGVQITPNENIIISYFDGGVGIAQSVKRSHLEFEIKTNLELINWALSDGKTSRPNNNNRGRGFSIMRNFVEKYSGTLLIRSDNYQIIFNDKKKTEKQLTAWYPGVQIVMYLPLSKKHYENN